jgi:hypothetical protein
MRRSKDNYLAGVWYRNLFRGILWSGETSAIAAITCRAPSWPWASTDGGVFHLGWGKAPWQP